MDRFDRNIRFFGKEGQVRLRSAHVAVVGCGGLGQHVIQQLAFLGVGNLTLIEDETLSRSNLNRYILARHDDPIPGTHKIDLALRALALIDPTIQVHPVRKSLRTREAFDALRHVHTVFGCVDNEGARLVLNEYAKAYGKTYYDVATDVEEDTTLRFGGRMFLVNQAPGCLVCSGELDVVAAREDLESEAARRDRAKIYGVDADLLDDGGPSVVSVNGVVASLAVTEYMVATTGIRKSKRHVVYRGNQGIVTLPETATPHYCYYCNTIVGRGAGSAVERYSNGT
jgi:molybdopterin/thiamine biosynthesis adenylyltransferase